MTEEEVSALEIIKKMTERAMKLFDPVLNKLLQTKGYTKAGEKSKLYERIEALRPRIRDMLCFELPSETEHMLVALNKPSSVLATYPLDDKNHFFSDIMAMLPPGSPLRGNQAFRELIKLAYDLSGKAVGRGEVLGCFFFENSSTTIEPGKDNAYFNSKGEVKTSETKSDHGMLKGVEEASRRIIDKLNEELLPPSAYAEKGATDGIFGQEDTALVLEFLKRLYPNFSNTVLKTIIEEWPSRDLYRRKQLVGAYIFLAYKEIDGFDSYIHYHWDESKSCLSAVIINDFSSTEELEKYLYFIPQIKRWGCTQALGDGCAEAKINLKELLG